MKILLLVLSLFSEVLCFDYKSFGCECGHHKNGKDGNLGCHPDQKNKIDQGFSVRSKNPLFQSRIVGGYNVEKHCFRRPSLAYIRIKHRSRDFWGECMGSIINKKFIITSAHCFCNPIFGDCKESNGEITSDKSRSGHPKYSKGNIESESDPDLVNRVKIIVPGLADSYSKDYLLGLADLKDHNAVKKIKEIIIHPEFVFSKRETNDVALIEIEDEFDFSKPLDLSPICLSENKVQDIEIPVFVTGYGQIFEGSVDKTACNTGFGGPSEFEPCRQFYIYEDDVYDHSAECNKNDSPATRDPDCQALHVAKPETINNKAIVHVRKDKTVHCYPLKGIDTQGWCSTCKAGAEIGEAGYCEDNEDIDHISVDQLSKRQDISPSEGWGYCDDNCFSNQVFKNELQEAALTTIKDEECLKLTEKYIDDPGFLYKRPDIDIEMCAAKRYSWNVLHYDLEKGEYELIKNETEFSYGGSDSCKGDSGGPLWMTFKEQAFLIGVTNRGTGCARKNNVGIYARISEHWDWIHKVAKSGSCSNALGTDYADNEEERDQMETKNRNENAPHGQDYQDEEINQPDDNNLVQPSTRQPSEIQQFLKEIKGRKSFQSLIRKLQKKRKNKNNSKRRNSKIPKVLRNHFFL